MHNPNLAKDYIQRAEIRLKAIKTLFDEKSWPDVIRESQECIELALKSFLRANSIDPPRIHDVSEVLLIEKQKLPKEAQKHIEKLAKISKSLRRDRELAFYGGEDLTPSEFYKIEDAEEAMSQAQWVVSIIKPFI